MGYYPEKSYDEISQEVDTNGGLITVEAVVLRDAQKADRLGIRVREAIKLELASRGLGAIPEDIPDRQAQDVRIYRKGSPIGQIVEAVLHPSDRGDEVLLSVGSGDKGDAFEVLEKIRELVEA